MREAGKSPYILVHGNRKRSRGIGKHKKLMEVLTGSLHYVFQPLTSRSGEGTLKWANKVEKRTRLGFVTRGLRQGQSRRILYDVPFRTKKLKSSISARSEKSYRLSKKERIALSDGEPEVPVLTNFIRVTQKHMNVKSSSFNRV